jgi:hypothetical protein
MTWTKLSDDFHDDCETLTDAAFRLHVEGLCWSNKKLLNCQIPKKDLRRFAHDPAAATELVNTGWWTDDGNDYTIRHHAMYQRTREQVVNQQAKNAANGRRGGRPPKTTETESISESLSETKTHRDRTGQEGQASTGREIWRPIPEHLVTPKSLVGDGS